MLYTVKINYKKDVFYDRVLPAFRKTEAKLGNKFVVTTEEDPLRGDGVNRMYGFVRAIITSDEYSFSPFWDEVRKDIKDI